MPLSTIFQLYHGVDSFIGGGNRSTRRKPAASHLQTLSDNVVSSTPRPSRIQTQSVSGDRPQWPLMMEETSPIKLIDFSGHKHGLYM
jgi:hypothetical protein